MKTNGNAGVGSGRCECGSEKTRQQCCDRFLEAGQLAKTPEQLMRSRYSAFARGGHGNYLLQTWFPPTAPQSSELELSQRTQNWTRLEVLTKSQQGDDGMVEFKAHYKDSDEQDAVLHEKSIFKRLAGRWLYVGGEVS